MIAWAGLLLGLEATAIGSLIAFGTAAIFLSFLLIAVAALFARAQHVLKRSRHARQHPGRGLARV